MDTLRVCFEIKKEKARPCGRAFFISKGVGEVSVGVGTLALRIGDGEADITEVKSVEGEGGFREKLAVLGVLCPRHTHTAMECYRSCGRALDVNGIVF